MVKKIRVGILDEVSNRHHYQMSLHPNFDLHYKDNSLVYFETIDADGKLKRVICTVEPASPSEEEGETGQQRRLACKEVLNIVEEYQSDIAAPPAAGKVVYLVREESARR